MRANGSRECAPDDGLREAIHLTACGGMDGFVANAPRNDGVRFVIQFQKCVLIQTSNSRENTRPRSRRMTGASFPSTFTLPQQQGRREDRVRAAPAVSCAKCTRKCAHEHTGSAETLRPSPRNGFTVSFVLSLVTGFVATIASRNNPQRLTPASGRQNHTTSPYA